MRIHMQEKAYVVVVLTNEINFCSIISVDLETRDVFAFSVKKKPAATSKKNRYKSVCNHEVIYNINFSIQTENDVACKICQSCVETCGKHAVTL